MLEVVIQAWTSDDGLAYKVYQHKGWGQLSEWWATIPRIIGVIVRFSDGSTHRMESSEYYAVGLEGEDRTRFWNGDGIAPKGMIVKAGIEVPDEVYAMVDEAMDRA